MTSHLLLGLLWGAVAGAALGAAFFLGLWATVTRVGRTRAAGAWLVGSFLLRLTLFAGGLYLISRGGQWPLIGALFGILAARPLVTRLVVPHRRPASVAPAVEGRASEEAHR